MTVTGIVRGIKPYGAFVELTPNLTGLAEPCPGLEENKLLVIDRLPPAPPSKLRYFVTSGHLDTWSYLPGDPPLW